MYWYSRYDSFINEFFVSKKIKIKAEIVLSPGGAYFSKPSMPGIQLPCFSTQGKSLLSSRINSFPVIAIASKTSFVCFCTKLGTTAKSFNFWLSGSFHGFLWRKCILKKIMFGSHICCWWTLNIHTHKSMNSSNYHIHQNVGKLLNIVAIEQIVFWEHFRIFISKKLIVLALITLAISKCYGKVRVLFFPRDNSLISRGNSHVSRVRGLVVRCLLFNPEFSCSNPWVCANFFTSIPKQKVLTFFGTMRLFGFVRLFFGFVRFFFEIF